MSMCFGSLVIETHVLNFFCSTNGRSIANETVRHQTFKMHYNWINLNSQHVQRMQIFAESSCVWYSNLRLPQGWVWSAIEANWYWFQCNFWRLFLNLWHFSLSHFFKHFNFFYKIVSQTALSVKLWASWNSVNRA